MASFYTLDYGIDPSVCLFTLMFTMYPAPGGVRPGAGLGLVSALPLTTTPKGEGQGLLHWGKITRFLLPVYLSDSDSPVSAAPREVWLGGVRDRA